MKSTTPSRGSPDSREPIRVLFVDTDADTTRGAKLVFEGEFGIGVTVPSRTEDVCQSLESVDCVVHQVHPPVSPDLDVLQDVCTSYPELPYIVFSAVRVTDLISDVLSAGATDYLRAAADDEGYRALASRVTTAVSGHYADAEQPAKQYSDVRDGSSLLDESLRFVAVSASYAAVHGYDSDQLIGQLWTTVLSNGEGDPLENLTQHLQSPESVVEEVVARRRDGTTFPALVSLARGTHEGFVCTIFDRRVRTRVTNHPGSATVPSADDGNGTIGLERAVVRLETLFTRRLEEGPDAIEDLCDAVVETIENGNDSAVVGVYLYDETSDALHRRAVTSRFDDSATTLPLDQSTPVWNAFVEHEPVLVSSLLPQPGNAVQDPGAARGLVVPVGTHGVLIAGTLEGARPTPIDNAFVRLVGATAGTILDRMVLKERLEDSKRQLETETGEIERLDRTVELVRAIGGVIGGAWTRPELEERVCKRIVSTDRYTFARIAEFDEIGEGIHERAHAGSENRYLESLDADASALADQREPMACTIGTLEACVHRGLLTDSIGDQWRQQAVSRGYRSVIGVPLVFRERGYGGLVVYSTRSDAFDETEREVFEEIGHWIAHANQAIETRTALVGIGGVELEFRISGGANQFEFIEWSRETGCRFEFETVVSRPDGSIRGFFTIDGTPPETILELASRSPSITEVGFITRRGEKHLFECTFIEESLVAHLLEYGAVPKTFSTSEAAGHLVVSLPHGTSVREFVDFFTRLYPDSTLVRRRDRESVARPGFGFRSELETELTAKQLEALETAFVSGYYEIPREVSGETVAELLGITQPTFNNHLRVAQRKLLSMVFDDQVGREE